MKARKIFILPVDGLNSAAEIVDTISDVLRDPENMHDFISHIKFNDAFHLSEGASKVLLNILDEDCPDINVFFDFKLADTNGTDKNILKHYIDFMKPGDIVTISSSCSQRAFEDVRDLLPRGVKIALVSVLTDTPREECRMRRGMVPEMAILNDAINLLEDIAYPFDAIVCSPAELVFLKRNLLDNIEYIVPGIRDAWMDIGQQSADRANGVREAIDAGANYLVMGSQLTKGNPQNGISAAKSRNLSIAKVY